MESYFGKNIRAIRKMLNLSVKLYSDLTGVSQTTIVNIEQGHTGLKVETMKKLIEFTEYSIDQVSSSNFKVPNNLKEELFSKFKDDPQMRDFFMNKPKILDAINKNLVDSKFFESFVETNEIVQYFKDKGLKINGTSLQNELKKHKQVEIVEHPLKKNTNLYRKKLK
ncbi:transcriptional regulator with XRE-family HTH domain [Sphingobacterium zeae]|uniref:Transcriptional regulator with XRE-family HTH domain n=1 Tax=Sphingobacterium zeae TaxID=1776859 RepID=A0ABU0U7C0_9SPHI|nr:helix-turn-helix transcriptional regulator [Sphingobacterium zeae]MDQ1150862.1 transcriptional regulator with XRE-family HTH domain [Sphingobacterium zeae]